MEKYGMEDCEMNSTSFSALLGGERGDYFSDDTRVENILELRQAFYNLILTMRYHYPPTGDEKRDAEQVKRYAKHFREQHCQGSNFNMIYLDKWDGAAKDVLAEIRPDLDIFSLSNGQLLVKIKEGAFGERLEALASLVNDMNNLLVLLLRDMGRSLEEGMDSGGMDPAQYYLSKSKRMKAINEIVKSGPKDDRWKALVEELVAVFKGDKLDLDYEKVAEGKIEKEGVKV
jgi:hypothetical protein